MKNITYERLKDFERDPSNNFLTRSEMMDAIKELIAFREALKGEQVPVGTVGQELLGYANRCFVVYSDADLEEGDELFTEPLFAAPQKPVVPVGFLFVVKATGAVIYSIADAAIEGTQLIGQIYGDAAIEAAGGIVKTEGESC